MRNPEQYTFRQIRDAFYTAWEEKESLKSKEEDELLGEEEEEFEGEYYQFKRWEEFMRLRLSMDGKVFNYNAKNQEELAKMQTPDLREQALHEPNWQSMGPSKIRLKDGYTTGVGRVSCIAFHPTEPNTFWVGTPAGGLWKTINNGDTWNCITDNFSANLGIAGIVVHPENPDILFVLTGDGDGGHRPSIGVLFTDDGGATWNTTSLSFGPNDSYGAFKILMKPGDVNTMYVATNKGLYITHDAFNSPPIHKLGNKVIYDIEFKPGDPNYMYLCTNGSFYRSKNGGDKWINITERKDNKDHLPDHNSNTRLAIAVSAEFPKRVYVAYATDTGYAGIFRADNNGQTFFQQTTDVNINLMADNKAGGGNHNQYRYDFTLFSPSYNADILILGGINLWKTLNHGTNWSVLSQWYTENDGGTPYVHADQHFMEMNPLNDRIYSGNDGGIYYSADTGKTWTDISNGLVITQPYQMSDVDHENSAIYFGAQDNGTAKLPLNNSVAIAVGDGDGAATGYKNGIVYMANNVGLARFPAEFAGDPTKKVAIGIPHQDQPIIFYPLTVDPKVNGVIYAGYDSIFKSVNNGDSWNVVPGDNGIGTINRITVSNSVQQQIYVATDADPWNWLVRYDGIGGKYDAGAPMNLNENWPISDICLSTDSSKSDRYVWVSFAGYNQDMKVFRTNDAGQSWIAYGDGLPNIPIICLAYLPGDSNHMVFAGTDDGVFYRDTTMSAWLPYSSGLPHVVINDLVVDTSTNTLYAATFGRGIWKSNLKCNSQLTKAVITGESIMCEGESLTLTADGPCGYDSYLWSNGETTKSIEISSPGTYSVTLSNGSDIKKAFHNLCTHNENAPPCLIWQESLGTSMAFILGSDQCEDGSTILSGIALDPGPFILYPGLTKLDMGGNVLWNKLFNDDSGGFYSVDQTDDGGFIAAGYTTGVNGGVPGYHSSGNIYEQTYDSWILKTDADGNVEWQRAYGGSGWEVAKSIHHTSDGGYIVLGTANSPDGDVTGWHQYIDPNGNSYNGNDLWLLKLDQSGNILWNKCLGGSGNEGVLIHPAYEPDCDIAQTFDGGYVIGGRLGSADGDVSPDVDDTGWLVKVDADGNILWQTSIGNGYYASIQSVLETSAHDIIVSGSYGGPDFTVFKDIVVAKFNATGQKIFETVLECPHSLRPRNLVETNSGKIIVLGRSEEVYGVNGTGHHGGFDFWVAQLNALGGMEWNQYYGGSENDDPYAVTIGSDGAITVGGFSNSSDGDITEFDPAYGYPYGWVINLGAGCPAPIKNFSTTSITNNSAVLQWGARTCVNGYQINYRMAGEEAWTVMEPGIAENQALFDLLPATDYEWRVRSTCQTQNQLSFSEYSPIQQFTTLPVKESNNQVSDFDYYLYPNPTNSGFTMELQSSSEGIGHLQIHSLVGKLVYETNLSVSSGQNIVEIGPVLPGQGLYFVTMMLNDHKLVRKIMRL